MNKKEDENLPKEQQDKLIKLVEDLQKIKTKHPWINERYYFEIFVDRLELYSKDKERISSAVIELIDKETNLAFSVVSTRKHKGIVAIFE